MKKKLSLGRQTLRTLSLGDAARARGGWYRSSACQNECTWAYSGCYVKSDTEEQSGTCDVLTE